jgi:hypothetical protein
VTAKHGNHGHNQSGVIGGYNVVDFRTIENTAQRAELSQADHVAQKNLGKDGKESNASSLNVHSSLILGDGGIV